MPQTSGPASKTPKITSHQRSANGTPDDTTPQPNAHIGANHVMGFISSSAAGIVDRGLTPADDQEDVVAVFMVPSPLIRTGCLGITQTVTA